MKKLLTLTILLMSSYCYGQQLGVGVRSGSNFRVFTTIQSDSRFAPIGIVTTVNSIITQNAAFSTQIATLQTAVINLTASVNTLKTDVADLKTKNTAQDLKLAAQQKTIDSLSTVCRQLSIKDTLVAGNKIRFDSVSVTKTIINVIP